MAEAKLDKILISLNSVSERLDTMESKLKLLSKRMDHLETKFDRMDERIDAFEENQKLENKTFAEAFDSKISKKQFGKLQTIVAMRMDHIFGQDRK